MTFYLKYRPQTLDDLDLEKVRIQLKQALSAKSIPHAFLFSGSRGLGKTSAARIVAKALNCETSKDKRKDDIEPCNQCDACISITTGRSSDIVEIDGASNRGIDDIRALREGVSLSPMQLKMKVYIIDEVHMLTKEAFNALLKTLEEPPEHVYFILATTEPHKIPETIISRSFHVQFARANKQEIARSLKRVTDGENLKLDDKVLEAIIGKTQGGFRDSVKLLEQLSFASKNITLEQFQNTFGMDDAESFVHLLQIKDGIGAFDWIYTQEQMGGDWADIIRNILRVLRLYINDIIRNNTNTNILLGIEEIILLITLCIQASEMQKTTLIETLPLELVVAKWIGKANTTSRPTIQKEEHLPAPSQNKQVIPQKQNNKITETAPASKPVQSDEKNDKSQSENTINTIPITNKKMPPIDEIKQKWELILGEIKPVNRSLESLLRGGMLTRVDGDVIYITVYYGLHKQQLESNKYMEIFESAFKNVFDAKPRFQYMLGDIGDKAIVDAVKDKELEKNVEDIFTI